MYDPKFTQKEMYDQYGSSRETTKTKPNPGKQFADTMKAGGGGRNTSGIGAKRPDYSSNTFGGGQDNNPNRDEFENKSTIDKLKEKAVNLFESLGADKPKALIVDGKRVYQGPMFRGYDPTVRIGQFGGDAGKKQYRFGMPLLGEVSPSYPSPTLPPADNNPTLNMFGVRRGFTGGPDMPDLSVSPEAPANMDPLTRGLSQAMLPQASPEMVDYTVGSFRDKENLMTIVEDLNKEGVDITLEELAKANNLSVNDDGTPTNPFVQKGEVLKVPTTRKPTVPTEFMDNATKAMLREATPTKANYVLDTAYSLANQLRNFTKKSQEKYTTGGTSLGDKDRSTYKVERGDTMYDIAKREGVTLNKLIEANPDVDADKIKAGQVINIPRGRNLDELSNGLKEEIIKQDPKTETDLNVAIFNGVIKDGTFATPKVGDDPLTWIAQNTFGLNENDPEFRKAFKAITKVDPYMTPWCAAFAGHVLRNVGVELPSRAIQNPNLAFNYINLGDEVYDHNPTTNKTYAGKPSDVKAGDVVVFNNSNRDSKGNIMYGQGHISFVVDVLDDGTIIATGGNQSDGTQVATTAYTPDIVKEYYKGGYTVRRITTNSLKGTDPSIIAAITKDISIGGAEQ